MIRHQFQPSPKSCGQTCLAMLLGIPVADVIAEIPDRAATTAGKLAAYLVMRGWTATKLRRYRGVLTEPAIARVIWPGRSTSANGHWVVYYGGCWFDPAGDVLGWQKRGGRIASYIALAPPSLKIGPGR